MTTKPPENGYPDPEYSRRQFLQHTMAGTAAIGLTGLAGAASTTSDTMTSAAASMGITATMPYRDLGKTGAKVSLLGFGGGSKFLAGSEDAAAAMLERAIAAGINYFDTASSYGKERLSEKRFGQVLPKHRGSVFLATKTGDRSYDAAMRSVEESLKCLRTDRLDLIQMHAIGAADDPKAWEKPDGALTALRKLRDQKVVRFIGFTGHEKAEVHRNVIESLDFDTVLMALNAADHKPFREIALPAAVQKAMGIIAMKTTKGLVGSGNGKASASELLQWTFDLPIATVIIGMETMDILNENVSLAAAYRSGAPNKTQAAALTDRLRPHVTAEQLGWAVPGYVDRWEA